MCYYWDGPRLQPPQPIGSDAAKKKAGREGHADFTEEWAWRTGLVGCVSYLHGSPWNKTHRAWSKREKKESFCSDQSASPRTSQRTSLSAFNGETIRRIDIVVCATLACGELWALGVCASANFPDSGIILQRFFIWTWLSALTSFVRLSVTTFYYASTTLIVGKGKDSQSRLHHVTDLRVHVVFQWRVKV